MANRKQHKVKTLKAARKNRHEEMEQSQKHDNSLTNPNQLAYGLASQSSDTILQLQRTIGNQATMRLLSQNSTVIQRWPKWLDKLLNKPTQENAPLLSGNEVDSGQDNELQNKQYTDLQRVKGILQSWANKWAIHKNYQKYAQYLGNTGWKKAMQVWGYVNKVLGMLSNLDPSGITQAIAAVSKLIKKLAEYVTEAFDMINDIDLVEQLTPLLDVNIIEQVKSSIEEIKDVWETGKSAWDAVAELV